jgi:DNA mismatch repair protein MutL
MSSFIQTLSKEVVHLIAAGEVIDSIAAVVRELVENALDAGATRIVICLFPELWQVQVADNGRGMGIADLQVCTNAHSTSKIHSIYDLARITTLGFRGEALHSVSQVAELEILSRSREENNSPGWRILCRGGKVVREEAVAIAPGTIVNVSDLFGNFPVRRKGLPPMAQQLKAVQAIIQQLALCHPQITWQVHKNEKLWFTISPAHNTSEIFPQVLSRLYISDLQLLSLETETPENYCKSKLELAIALPDRYHRRRPDWVRVAINGRMVKVPELEQTMLGAFAKTLPRDRYPLCFLHLHIPPTQIDWNRHPAKTEVYLHHLEFWQEKAIQAIQEALALSPANLPQLENQRVEKLIKAAEAKSPYQPQSEAQISSPETNLNLIELRAVGQILHTYIVAEHPTGLWLVEQHIADERIIYEQLQDSWEILTLEKPILLSHLSPAQVEQLQRIGLEIDSFGEQLWSIRSAPAILARRSDCSDALLELSRGGDLPTAQVATACRSALRNGTPLSLAAMQGLLDRWKHTRNPRTCPHGRPIYLSLEESSLARFFRRHWVVGKSHGI